MDNVQNLDLSQYPPDQQAFIMQALMAISSPVQAAQPEGVQSAVQTAVPQPAIQPVAQPSLPAAPVQGGMVVMVNGVPCLVQPMAGFNADPNCGIGGTDDNVVTGALGNVNDVLKNGAEFLLGVVGGIVGFAIDIVTLGQRKQ